MYIKLGLFINGKWKYNSEKYSDVINPADESILGKLPHASKDDLDAAKEHYEEAMKHSANLSGFYRSLGGAFRGIKTPKKLA